MDSSAADLAATVGHKLERRRSGQVFGESLGVVATLIRCSDFRHQLAPRALANSALRHDSDRRCLRWVQWDVSHWR